MTLKISPPVYAGYQIKYRLMGIKSLQYDLYLYTFENHMAPNLHII